MMATPLIRAKRAGGRGFSISFADELELAFGAVELMSVGIAADHDGRALGQAQIALA